MQKGGLLIQEDSLILLGEGKEGSFQKVSFTIQADMTFE